MSLTFVNNPQEDPLFTVIKTKNQKQLRELFSQFNNQHLLNKKSTEGHSPLFLAAYVGNIEAIDFLIDQGANPKSLDKFGNTLVHISAKINNSLLTAHLIKKHHIDPAQRNFELRSALFEAVFKNYIEVIDVLLRYGKFHLYQYDTPILHNNKINEEAIKLIRNAIWYFKCIFLALNLALETHLKSMDPSHKQIIIHWLDNGIAPMTFCIEHNREKTLKILLLNDCPITPKNKFPSFSEFKSRNRIEHGTLVQSCPELPETYSQTKIKLLSWG